MALKTDVVSVLELDEASGNAIDSHGSSNLTENGTIGSVTGPSGLGGARQFQAAMGNEYFSLADNTDLSSGDVIFTLSAWVKLATKTTQRPVAGKWSSGQREYLLFWNVSTDRWRFIVSSDGTTSTAVQADNGGSPSTGTWYHLVAWHDSVSNVLGISVNAGTPNTLSYSSGVRDGTAAFEIGRNGEGPIYIDADIAQVAFRKGSLWTSDERAELYASGNGLPYSSWDAGGGVTVPLFEGNMLAGGLLSMSGGL